MSTRDRLVAGWCISVQWHWTECSDFLTGLLGREPEGHLERQLGGARDLCWPDKAGPRVDCQSRGRVCCWAWCLIFLDTHRKKWLLNYVPNMLEINLSQFVCLSTLLSNFSCSFFYKSRQPLDTHIPPCWCVGVRVKEGCKNLSLPRLLFLSPPSCRWSFT